MSSAVRTLAIDCVLAGPPHGANPGDDDASERRLRAPTGPVPFRPRAHPLPPRNRISKKQARRPVLPKTRAYPPFAAGGYDGGCALYCNLRLGVTGTPHG
jgi:hypothetical protein